MCVGGGAGGTLFFSPFFSPLAAHARSYRPASSPLHSIPLPLPPPPPPPRHLLLLLAFPPTATATAFSSLPQSCPHRPFAHIAPMAKRKTAARKARQPASSAGSDALYRGPSSSKHASASPSVVSSPSPQPQDLVQRRRKGTPVRSPSQGDPSKGIVFAFRIQNDPDLSMAVDILSYDQVPEDGLASATTAPSNPAPSADPPTRPSAAITVTTGFSSGKDYHQAKTESTVVPTNRKVAGEHWSSDPSSYLSSNVMDLSRNVLILHSRRPQETSSSPTSPLFHPYRRPSAVSRLSSLPSTPSLTDSASSSASNSPSSSPSSPTLFHLAPEGACSDKEDLCSLEPLSSPSIPPLDAFRSQPARMLQVRGMGAGGRRMQVYLV
ncbi:hypothetical protein B0O80DRAFT_433929 [Mortierella sp. GBAus27b]|nr:hypothetical protein B0O80DRAFT_433929 [Mortierella sp. GBAus27b]